jgi:hypothetical protein
MERQIPPLPGLRNFNRRFDPTAGSPWGKRKIEIRDSEAREAGAVIWPTASQPWGKRKVE